MSEVTFTGYTFYAIYILIMAAAMLLWIYMCMQADRKSKKIEQEEHDRKHIGRIARDGIKEIKVDKW